MSRFHLRINVRLRWLLTGLAALALAAGSGVVYADRDDHHPRAKQRFEFALWGDMPYSDADAATKVPALIEDMNDFRLAFTVFDGDTKSGSSACTDQVIVDQAKARFNTVKAPTVYVPGDNEWTDCHRKNNSNPPNCSPPGPNCQQFNNLERLDFLRANMFNSPFSFGKTKLKLDHQGQLGKAYSENTRWMYGGIVFVGLNVPGSNNNLTTPADCPAGNSNRTQADCDADNVEYQARDAKNIEWLNDSFALAKQKDAPAIMLVIQADPGFDLPETTANERADPGVAGYTNFLNTLLGLTQSFDGEVVLVHGDTHFYKVDKPLVDQAHLVPNLTRLETFGQVNVHWVKVSVDPNSRNVFTFEPMIVPGN
jgi:hypothetical protein